MFKSRLLSSADDFLLFTDISIESSIVNWLMAEAEFALVDDSLSLSFES